MDIESEHSLLPVSPALAPIPALSQAFLDALGSISPAAVDNALLSYALVYSSTNGKIILRKDQILAAVQLQEGRDVVKIARTGSGKTMQIVIAALLNPSSIILVLSPLIKLQDSMVAELNGEYRGIRAIAVNHQLRHNHDAWREIENGDYNIILTSPEQCKPLNGHPTRLHNLLRKNKPWSHSIAGLVCDEAHMIALWGLVLGNQDAFRPAWGQLWDLRIALRVGTPTLCLSATAPPHILASLSVSLGLKSPCILKSSVNRANQVYALHPIFGGLKNYANLRMLVRPEAVTIKNGLEVPISLDYYVSSTPKTVVFMDDSEPMVDAHTALYNFTPLLFRAELKSRGFIRFYHAGMSDDYLEEVYASFVRRDGTGCRILFATSAFSLGINVPDINIVVQYGLCQFIEELLQRFGRNSRLEGSQGLSLLMYEGWAENPSQKPTKREKRTMDSVKQYAALTTCLRAYLAKYSHDTSSEALLFSGTHCCDQHDDDNPLFDLQSLVLGPLLLDDSPLTPIEPPVRVRNKYRPTWQRPHMAAMLKTWVESLADNGKIPRGYPDYFVLCDDTISELIRMPHKTFTSAAALTEALDESEEWSELFAQELYGNIVQFEKEAKVKNVEWESMYKAGRTKGARHSNESESDNEETGSEDADSEGDKLEVIERPRKRVCLAPGLTLIVPVYD